jgi:hypothetical protein
MRKIKKIYELAVICLFFSFPLNAQQLNTNMDSTVTTFREVTIKGKLVKYKATAGKQPVWDEKGNIIAGLYFTYYEKLDVKDKCKKLLSDVKVMVNKHKAEKGYKIIQPGLRGSK